MYDRFDLGSFNVSVGNITRGADSLLLSDRNLQITQPVVISKTNDVFIISNWLQGSNTIITARNGRCGKVMFSPVSVGIVVPCPFWGRGVGMPGPMSF